MKLSTEDRNQYEEIIDQMMIEEVSGLDTEIKETLINLDSEKKRMAILSILDKDRDMFLKIKNIVDNTNVSKSEHIKNVVKMLREYVEVGDREQKAYGEVFTQYWTVKEMLDLIPQEDWSNPDLTFLDTSAGVGNFPAVIIERLMAGLSEVFPDEEERYTHIVENMIHMCELQSKNAFLILTALDPHDIYGLNIFNGSFLSEEFDTHTKDVWGVEKFDYIIQNPPYQKMDGGHAASALPLYNIFIEKSIEICDKLISIHPSRWMGGGRGLNDFRKFMFNRKDIKTMVHFDNSQDVFGKNVDIRSGVQYMLIDNSYKGLTNYNGIDCILGEFDIFVEPKYRSIVRKMDKKKGLNIICRSRSTYPIQTNDSRLTDTKINDDYLLCYVSKAKGFIKYVDSKHIIRNIDTIKEFKVMTVSASGKGGDGFGNTFIGKPGEISTDTYISFDCDNDENKANSLLSYMDTKFSNFLLGIRKISQHIKPDTCKWIPLVPFDRQWTDEMLFERFELTEEEIEIINNSNI